MRGLRWRQPLLCAALIAAAARSARRSRPGETGSARRNSERNSRNCRLALLAESVLQLALERAHARCVGERVCLALVGCALLGVRPAGEHGKKRHEGHDMLRADCGVKQSLNVLFCARDGDADQLISASCAAAYGGSARGQRRHLLASANLVALLVVLGIPAANRLTAFRLRRGRKKKSLSAQTGKKTVFSKRNAVV